MPKTAFELCPKCGEESICFDDVKKLNCVKCGWTYFHNVATAVAGILRYSDEIVFTVRAHNPDKGMLDLPGGFVDPDESAEQALKREVKEELGIQLQELKFLFSFPNKYEYKGVSYNTCDLFFEATISHKDFTIDYREIESVKFMKCSEVPLTQVAFQSIRNGIKQYCKKSERAD